MTSPTSGQERPAPPAPATPCRRRGGLAVLALVAAGGVVLAGARSRTDTREALPDAPPAGPDAGTVAVTAEAASCRPVQRSVEATGTLYGFEEVTLAAKVEGRVRAVR